MNKIFVSIKSDWYGSSLYYFYSQDSVLCRVAGNELGKKYGYNLSNKGVVSITENGETKRTTIMDETYDETYELLGDQVLQGKVQSYYGVRSFIEAFQINQ